MSKGTDLIAAERRRQIAVEGYTPEHDDEHDDDALARSAMWLFRLDIPEIVAPRSGRVPWHVVPSWGFTFGPPAVGRRTPRRVFLGSMTDLFHDDVPESLLFELLDLLHELEGHVWMLLTKRPARMAAVVAAWCAARGRSALAAHIWVGTTVEDQRRADERIPHLLRVPAPVRFLSCEPLLGPVDLDAAGWWSTTTSAPCERCEGRGAVYCYDDGGMPGQDWCGTCSGNGEIVSPGIRWVIAGGESGPRARPSHPDWFRSLRDRCAAAGVPFHFKQWGEFGPSETWVEGVGWRWPGDDGYPLDAPVRRKGKHAAGRLLDGRTHDDFPAVEVPCIP